MPEARQSAAIRTIEPLDADALLVLGLVNIRYLSGFTGSDGALILTADDRYLLCDSRYTLQAGSEVSLCAVSEYKTKLEGITSHLSEKGFRRVAFDAEKVPVAFFNSLTAALPGVEFIPLSDQLDQLRSVKSPEEIDLIAFSAGLASSAFEELLHLIKPGVSERELALKLEILMKNKGAEEKAFDFIVASGDRGALPHGKPTDRLLSAGEMVTIDFGACCNGYYSDETVTVAIGEPETRLIEIYNAVQKAHDLALSAVRPGIECKTLDEIARSHINSCGFGEFFGHGLGHGVGLEIHEKPTISSRSSQTVEAGMIFTIEPGIYIPGLGGVRIEDLVEVTLDGCRVLSKIGKELIVC
jgi:Xaa-Pro aminopeptidase